MNIYKEPVTDPGKTSKKGRMTLELDEKGRYVTRTEGTGDPAKVDVVTVPGNHRCTNTVVASFSAFLPPPASIGEAGAVDQQDCFH